MMWTNIDAHGQLIQVDHDGTIHFVNGISVPPLAPVYVPVVASDGIDALVAFREQLPEGGPKDEPVWVVASNGASLKLPFTCEGKRPLAVKSTGIRAFEVVAIGPGCVHVSIADVYLGDSTIRLDRVTPNISIPTALVLLEIMADGALRFANGDGIEDVRAFTRNSVTKELIYYREVNGRVIGAEAGDAPNHILLGDVDGWYRVTDAPNCTAFPAFLSNDGVATTFEGLVFTLEDIRIRPLTPDAPGEDYDPTDDLRAIQKQLAEVQASLSTVIVRLP